jgi:riboflavin kinase/FMN adenylyltransferase
MRVFHSADAIPPEFGPSVVTIGNFDGVHTGHREIMRRVTALALERNLTPTVLTFDPHPARVLAPERAPKLILTVPQRLRRLSQAGIEAALLLPFSMEFAKLSPEQFACDILARALKARVVLVGEDFRFGFRQSGDIETLRNLGAQLGFELQPVTAVSYVAAGKSERISSTRIRELIGSGRVSRACRMMGEPFALEGPVVPGHGIGSKKTVPTLNLAAENELLPKTGVYVTRTRDEACNRQWPSITNVGYRPTFGGQGLTIETYLLEAAAEEAPERIEVAFLTFVRDEIRFESPESLKARIIRDAAAAKRFHTRFSRLGMG